MHLSDRHSARLVAVSFSPIHLRPTWFGGNVVMIQKGGSEIAFGVKNKSVPSPVFHFLYHKQAFQGIETDHREAVFDVKTF